MASTRKKQDEKNLKTLRELVSLPHNKYCFDCNQRGPTYVNVTIGSFVCTKCSGILRGLTPPHRVKSISMATFTQEEVDLMQQRGNDYCRRTWLGLYEGQPLTEGSPRDEQQVHDLMVDKYERRRYYLEPTVAATLANQRVKPLTSLVSEPKPIRLNGTVEKNERNLNRTNGITISRPTISNSINSSTKPDFIANFEQADIFNATNNNSNSQNISMSSQHFFANFENNPVFSNISTENFSIFDLQFSSNNGPMLNQVPLFPKCNANRWSKSGMPDLNNINKQQKNDSLLVHPAPPEDRYLPLKDLDNAMKTQTTIDWNSASSNGSGSAYSSSTPSGSMYSSSSPQSAYGSPNQGQFSSLFSPHDSSNPFNVGNQNFGTNWGTTNGFTNNASANPFKHADQFKANVDPFTVNVDPFKANGFSQSYQPAFSTPFNGQTWTPNPFKVATTNGHSSNPFL